MTPDNHPYDMLRCPNDHGELCCDDVALSCGDCGAQYKVCNGIPVFDITPDWERQYKEDTTYYALEEPKALDGDISYLHLRGDDAFGVILDLGAGDGVYASAAPDNSIAYCVDVAPTGLQRVFKRNQSNLIPVAASGYQLPFENNSIDTILYIFVVEHLAKGDDLRMLAEARRVLRPGTGRMIYVTDTPFFDRHLVKWTNLLLRGKRSRRDHNSSTGHVNLMNMSESKLLVDKARFQVVAEHRFWMGERFRIWSWISRLLRKIIPENVANDYLASKYAFVLKK